MKLLYNESIITNRHLTSRLVKTPKMLFFSVYTEGSSFSTKSALTLCWLVLSMGLSVTAFAQKYVKVTATGSADGSSWDNALGATSLKTTIEAGGIVYVAAGTYNPTATTTLNAATNQIIGGFAATATGTSLSSYNPAINQTIISASAMSAGLKRVFYSTSLSVELKGLVLQDGAQGTTGGAVYVGSGKVLKFTDLVIKNNTAGGIGVYSVTGATASVNFTNCVFLNNTNTGSGGALVCSTVYENPDPFAIAPTAGKFTMTNCSFDGNTSSNQGGAIEFTTSHAWEISGTCFSNNSAFLAGGVIFTTSKKNILTGCNFTNNTATTAEGGAMIATTASATLTNCNFVGNTAIGTGTGYGGAIFATTASLTMSGTKFYNNSGKAAGAIYSTTWTNSLRSTATNCIFSSNAATNTLGTTTGTNGGGAMVINANANGWDVNGCTFANNTVPANGWGGAVSHYDAETTFNNTVFYNNTKGGVANISGSDIKNYDNAGHFNTLTNCTMQLANATDYTNQAGGTDAASYGFGAGNTFSNTTNPNVAAAPTITCPIAISSTCATPSVGGTATHTGGTVCATANIGTITLTGQTGNVLTWQTSTNGGAGWTDIPSTLGKTTYNFINAANGQQFRAVVNANIVTCTDEFSSVVTITTSATACTTTTCSYTSGSFSPTIATTSNATYTTHVILVNPTTGAITNVTAANSTAFTGVAVGDYIMYAVTYDNTITPIPTLTVGTNITALTGCFTVSDPLITKVCCPTVVPTTTVSQPTCSVTTGTITVNTPSTGVTYSFDNGTTYQASNIKSGLAAATTYQVVVKDDVSGCSSTATPSVVNPKPILSAPTASVSTQPTCLTATASVYLSGLPSTGTWTLTRLNTTTLATFVVTSTGAGSAFSYGNVPSGTYTYTVKNNATNCESTASNSITVNAQPASPTITNVAKGDPSVLSCPALNNGEVSVTATGSNLEYSRDNGATWQASNTFTALVAGSYNIKVRDNVSGCDVAYPSNPVVLAAPICNQYPNITSPLTATTPENVSPTTPVYSVTSTDPNVGQAKTFSFETGGVDNAKFNIDPMTGVVTFIASPDFDLPTDDNGDNIYEIIVKVCDNGTPQYCATQAVQITVTDIDECVGFAAPIVAVNQPNCTTATGTITITTPTTGVMYSFDNGVSFQASNVLSNVTAGVYQIVIKNGIGCKTVPKDYTAHPAPTVGCSCNNATGTLVSTVSNQNTGVDYTQKYVLTDNAGVIAQMANTPSFTGLTSTTYAIYAVNYKTTEGVNGLTIGQNIAGANSPCLDVSKPLFYTVCLPVFVCNNVSGNITAVVSGQNIGATFTQSYVLTDDNEVIIRLSTTPSFTGLVNGRYKFYGVNYETVGGITGLTLGQNISGLAGACLNVSEPLLYQVCQVPEICNNRIDDDGDGLIDCEDSIDCPSCGCDNTTGDITFTNTGQTITDYTQVYVLTDSTGKILKTNTAATFTGLSTGRYRVYAINYKTADGITGITVGGNIDGVTGLCFDKSLPLLFKVCLCVTMNVKVMLEGPYQTATSDMQTMLNQRGLLPGQTPVGQFALPTPQGQPYKGAPWNYLGTEGDTITTYPATVVDWVLLTLRTDATSTNNVFRVTGWLHNDGHISFISPCFDIANGSYYVVIEHRNHVGVMSPNRVLIINGVLTHDFTVNDSYVLINPPSFGQKQKGSKWMMYAGDGKKILTTDNYDVNASDSQYWKGQSGTFDQYKGGDYNMDADVNFADSYLWKFNSGKYSGVPH